MLAQLAPPPAYLRVAAKHRAREEGGRGHSINMPGNYNANFHQHRREFAIQKRAEFGGKGKGGGYKGGYKGGYGPSYRAKSYRGRGYSPY